MPFFLIETSLVYHRLLCYSHSLVWNIAPRGPLHSLAVSRRDSTFLNLAEEEAKSRF